MQYVFNQQSHYVPPFLERCDGKGTSGNTESLNTGNVLALRSAGLYLRLEAESKSQIEQRGEWPRALRGVRSAK